MYNFFLVTIFLIGSFSCKTNISEEPGTDSIGDSSTESSQETIKNQEIGEVTNLSQDVVAQINSLESYRENKRFFTKKRHIKSRHYVCCDVKIARNHEPNYTSEEHIRTIYQLVRDTKEILDAHKVVWWADGGTLLGVKRHKGIIPWDDDADIIIHPMHSNKLYSMKETFSKYGLRLSEHTIGFKVSFDKEWAENNTINGFQMTATPELDIFPTVFAEEDHEEIHYKVDAFTWGNRMSLDGKVRTVAFLAESEVRALQEETFGSFKIYTPRNSQHYLRALYGKDYMTTAIQAATHNNIRPGGEKTMTMKESFLSPAQPAMDSISRIQEPVQKEDWVYRYYHNF